jgi:O-antigen ligase
MSTDWTGSSSAASLFVALAAAAIWFRWWEPYPRVSVIGIAGALIGGYPIFKEAFENIVHHVRPASSLLRLTNQNPML